MFVVRDYGVGVFRTILRGEGIGRRGGCNSDFDERKNDNYAERAFRGGIFWVSKLAKKFVLGSYEYELVVDNVVKDYAIRALDNEIEGQR